MNTIQITAPDDWHLHLRDGPALKVTANDAARTFKRAIIMPNLVPPITTVAQAQAYRDRVMAALQAPSFTPMMTLYLHQDVTPDEISLAHQSEHVAAVKWYPKGVTTNSDAGTDSLKPHYDTIQAMSECGMPLLIHGESPAKDVDIFAREHVFLTETLGPLIKLFPKLNIVLEHISTKQAVDFVKACGPQVAATITAHHLWINRNDLLSGGIKPHYYCLPIVKTKDDQQALIEAATSGNPKFFLGTDSAPHAKAQKESACGCAGVYTAPHALALYAQVFEAHDRMDKLEGFASYFGADFYQVPRNTQTIQLSRKPWQIPESIAYGDDILIPFLAGHTLNWQVENAHG